MATAKSPWRGCPRGLRLLSLAAVPLGKAGGSGLHDSWQLLQLRVEGNTSGSDHASARGYFYEDITDGQDPRTYEPPVVLPEASAWADGRPGSRVLAMDSTFQGISAIDDVALKLKILLMLASALHAVPAVGRPRTLLGGRWGNSTTDSWDDYVGSEPRLLHTDEVKCAEKSQVRILRHQHWLGTLAPDALADLFDRSRSLCAVIQFLIFDMRPDWHAQGPSMEWGVVLSGHPKVHLWKSQHVMDLVSDSRQQVPMLRGEYNVVHVRRGDFKHGCTRAERIVSRLKAKDSSRPWLVMTDGERAWIQEFEALASAAGLRYVLENHMDTLSHLDDNFLRYQTLQCLYGYAVHRVATLKTLQGYCRVPGQHVELWPELLCHASGDPSHTSIEDF